MSEVTCPGCGTVTHLEAVRRHAEEFCRTCDYPLFWARSAAALAGAEAVGEGAGLRRLPGTAGRVTVARVDCWSCAEPNLATAERCVRCGADLAGPPPEPEAPLPPPPPPAPEPEPEPEPEDSILPWVVLGAIVVGLVLLVVLTSLN